MYVDILEGLTIRGKVCFNWVSRNTFEYNKGDKSYITHIIRQLE